MPVPYETIKTIAVVLTTLILSYFTLILGELVPKRLAMRKSEQMALGMAPMLCGVSKIFTPIVWLLSASTNLVLHLLGIDPNEADEQVSEEEIRLMVDEGSQKGVIDEQEQEMIQNVFEFDDLTVEEFATHRTDVAVLWLEDFLSDYFGTVLVVSHDRHFLNDVCTNIVDIDYNGIKMYVGNYEFWYESSQLIQRMMKQQNKKAEEKIRELQTFISRFSANKSKSRQATSRRKLLDKLTVEELPASSRRYPFIGFDMDRVAGKDILFVRDLTKTAGGVTLFKDLSFTVNKEDKIALVGSEQAITALFRILMEEDTPDSGDFKWGVSITKSYFPHDNTPYFKDCDLSVIDWLGQYSKETTETYLRGFLGRMLFSGDSVFKPVKVLSGGEKVRCMFSRMMLFGSNFLLLDQPTDHLDLESISAVNNGLSAFRGNVIFSSHDYELVNTVANRIIEITPDGMRDYSGTFEDYLARKKEEETAQV